MKENHEKALLHIPAWNNTLAFMFAFASMMIVDVVSFYSVVIRALSAASVPISLLIPDSVLCYMPRPSDAEEAVFGRWRRT